VTDADETERSDRVEQGKSTEAPAMYGKARAMAPPAQHARIDDILSER
jgi:hypothetical protein